MPCSAAVDDAKGQTLDNDGGVDVNSDADSRCWSSASEIRRQLINRPDRNSELIVKTSVKNSAMKCGAQHVPRCSAGSVLAPI